MKKHPPPAPSRGFPDCRLRQRSPFGMKRVDPTWVRFNGKGGGRRLEKSRGDIKRLYGRAPMKGEEKFGPRGWVLMEWAPSQEVRYGQKSFKEGMGEEKGGEALRLLRSDFLPAPASKGRKDGNTLYHMRHVRHAMPGGGRRRGRRGRLDSGQPARAHRIGPVPSGHRGAGTGKGPRTPTVAAGAYRRAR